MAYWQCSHCNTITDEDEAKCPICGKNFSKNKKITYANLISEIKEGKISPSVIRIKSPYKIHRAFSQQGLPY